MSEEITLGDPDATILVLHDPGLDPLPFIRRLIRGAEGANGATSSAGGGDARGDAGASTHPSALEPGTSSTEADAPVVLTATGAGDDDDGLIPWTISNKYYTAPVCFRPHSLDRPLPDPHPVIMYVWSGSPPDPLPAALTRLSVADPPPDISLAVRLGHGRTRDADEERFAELGLDVVDEAGASDDDERPLDPLDIVRQTLMTHMWPTMERRPAGRHAAGPEARLGAAMASLTAAHAFPVTFSDERAPPRAAGPASDFPTPEAAGYGAVPQDPADTAADADSDDDDFGDFAAGAGQPGAEEYARLDEWLDGDDEPMPVVRGEATGADAGAEEVETPALQESRHTDVSAAPQANGHGHSPAADTFEDDFGPPPDTDTSSLPLDPTPILLHLQHVRAELADLDDEDERRVRAGVEVARLMRSLGMGDDDLGLEDLQFDEAGAELDGI